MFVQQTQNASNEYQREYQKLRTKRVVEILNKGPSMSNDDFVFLDNFIKTYFSTASKAIKTVLTQEALKKVYQTTKYKELDMNEVIFTSKDIAKYYILVISGNIEVKRENRLNDSSAALKAFGKGEIIDPNEMLALAQSNKDLKGVCAEKSEVLMYEKAYYDSIVKEFASSAITSKLKAVSKNFLKIKKMNRNSKEEQLAYFKLEKFQKGTVIVNLKSRIEELYILLSGKVVLCAQNENIPSYPYTRLVFGILQPESVFNELPLLFEKPSPYYAICLEDIEILSVGKANLGSVTDIETIADLRANCQCKQRLQSVFLEKYMKMSKEEIEKSQNTICQKAGFKVKDVLEVFERYDPKSKNSLHFIKCMQKFNQTVEKSNEVKNLNAEPQQQKFSDFATPRLVTKDPNFRMLDPKRQLALLHLRSDGANRRAGNIAPQKNLKDMNKDDIVKMQSRLLNEEKAECEKIAQKKIISEKVQIGAPEEEKEGSDKKGLFSKMKMDNEQLLANFKINVAEKEEKETNGVTENKPFHNVQEPKPIVTNGIIINKPASDSDEIGLKNTQKCLANLLAVNSPQFIVNKRRNILKNINLK